VCGWSPWDGVVDGWLVVQILIYDVDVDLAAAANRQVLVAAVSSWWRVVRTKHIYPYNSFMDISFLAAQ